MPRTLVSTLRSVRPARRAAGVAATVALVVTGGVAVTVAGTSASFAGTTTPQIVSSTRTATTSRTLPADEKVRVVAKSWKKNTVVPTAATVGAVLSAHGVHPDSNDKVYVGPASSSDRSAGIAGVVTVKRVSVVKRTTRKKMHYKTVVKHDKHRYKTLHTLLKRKGHSGTRTVVQRLTVVDGAVAHRTTVSSRSTVRNKIVLKGTKKAPRKATVKYSRAVGKDLVTHKGWSNHQYQCLVTLWNRESGWRVTAYNRSSGARGIPQALPGRKMAIKGKDWKTNPKTQIAWGLGYIKGRYHTPCGALSHSYRTGWY